MTIKLRELHKGHDLVMAAHSMVHAHMDNESALPALEDVSRQYPDVPADYLICLWVGVNAKDREGPSSDPAWNDAPRGGESAVSTGIIPGHICSLCYHPKQEWESCYRQDCESKDQPAGQQG